MRIKGGNLQFYFYVVLYNHTDGGKNRKKTLVLVFFRLRLAAGVPLRTSPFYCLSSYSAIKETPQMTILHKWADVTVVAKVTFAVQIELFFS